ncbi:uncharacterized protein [Solanum lycopersicum]|uniref:uncharacterized protein n=1 Tax=Solanum lycopersicum TaxID=4081 RepID=UPI003747BB64
MSCFVTGVSEDLQEKCHLAMLNDNMSISRLMVHARRVDEARDKRKSRDGKREKSFDGGSSKNRLEIQDKPRFKKQVSNQVPYKFPKARSDRESNPKFKRGKCTNSPNEKPTCAKCKKVHFGEFLVGTRNYFSCGKSGHKMRFCPNLKSQNKSSGQAQASDSSDAPKKNHFYALRYRLEQETSPDVVTVSNPVVESVVAKRVYRNCPIMLPNRVSYVDQVELNMLDFDIILGQEWRGLTSLMNPLLSGKGEILFLEVVLSLV